MELSDQAALMGAFVEIQLAPGVAAPERPPGPPPPWMALRPAGLRALTAAFAAADLDTDSLRTFDGPVNYALGGKSNPDLYARSGERLGTLFEDFRLERYEDRHHFDPPHRIEPARVATALRTLWADADARGLP